MNKINKTIKLAAIFLLVFFLNACHKALDLKPFTSIEAGDVVKEANVKVLLNGAYVRLRSQNYYGRDFQVITDLLGDDVKITGQNSNRFTNEFQYLYTRNSGSGVWSKGYQAIYIVNRIIRDLPENDNTKPYLGEAYFVRALAHFDMLRRHSKPYSSGNKNDLGVPIVHEIAADPKTFAPKRNTIEACYEAIIKDLDKAKTLSRDAQTGSDLVFRASKQAATALLARVYLYKQEWQKAITEVDALGTQFPLWQLDDVTNAFTKTKTSEEIFTLRFMASETLTSNNYGYIYVSKEAGGYGDIRPASTWYSLLDAGDKRLGWVTKEGETLYLNNKFKGNASTAQVGLLDIKILRSAEMHLIKAEAMIEGGLGDPTTMLNEFRKSRGLADLASGADIKAEIKKQRRLELIGEGHRAFDIFRKGDTRIAVKETTDPGVLSSKDIPADNYMVAFPIPLVEMDANSNMVQNDGY